MAQTKNGIIYPNDYNSIADIPKDLESMAKSIDENIEDLKKQQNIQNVDISKLQREQEEQNTSIIKLEENYTKQNNLINKLKANQINSEVIGESINVKDSSNLPSVLEILGNAKQEVREGYNLLYLDENISGTKNGITYSWDGTELTLNGTSTADTDIYNFGNWGATSENEKRFLKAGTYTIYLSEGNKDYRFSINAYLGTKLVFGIDRLEGNKKTVTLDGDTYYSNCYISILNGKTFNNEKFKIMLVNGTEEKQYEAYGKTPTPEIESLIENVKDNVKINVINKNLFTKENIRNGYRLDFSGELFATAEYSTTDYIKVEPNIIYSFSWEVSLMETVCCYDKNKKFIYRQTTNTNTVKMPIDCYYIKVSILTNKLEMAQIEQNEQLSLYLPHKNKKYTLPIQKPMLKIGENQDRFIKRDSKWYEEHNIGKIIFDGEENKFTSKSAIDINNLFQTFAIPNIKKPIDNNTKAGLLSNYFIDNTANTLYFQNKIGISGRNGGDISIGFGLESGIDTLDKANQFLKEKNNSGNTVTAYYPLITPELLECTEEQSQILEELNNMETYYPVTNINTDSIAILNLKYIADTKLYIDNEINGLKTNLSTINELLSSKTTSALLLDNMQKDLESEVI